MGRLCTRAHPALALSLLLVVFAAARAEQPPMVFTHLSTAEGLSQVSVADILQDSQGFIWLATENGLNRYDGNELKQYFRARDNPDGLASDYLGSMAEDRAGNIWITTEGGGIARWNPRTESFTNYRHIPGDERSIASDFVLDLLIDKQGRVWLTLRDRGLDRLDPVTGEVTHFVHDSARPNSLGSNKNLNALLEDRDGSIWVSTSAGLDRYLGDGKGFEHFEPPVVVGASHTILELAQDNRGDIWLGSFDAGLQRLNPATGQFTSFQHSADNPDSLSSNDVRAIFEDSAKRLWIGTANGLDLFNRRTGTFQSYRHERSNPHSLTDNFVVALTEDRNGMLWIGTKNAGASRWNPSSWFLGHHLPEWLQEQASIVAFADAPDGGLWVGTMGEGLIHLDAAGRATSAEVNEALGDDLRVMSLLNDRKGQLWIGTMSTGLSRMGADGSFKTFRAADTPGLGADGIMSLYEDQSGHIWIGTYQGGVSVYNPDTGIFRRYTDTTGRSPWLERARAIAIREDHQGRIWVATDGDGLLLLDAEHGLLHQFLNDPNDSTSLGSNTLYSLHIDQDGVAWIGTANAGLDRVADMTAEPPAMYFENLSQADGLPNNVINGIQPDGTGALWLPSNNGLIRFDPKTKSIRTFHASHGAQAGEYTAGAFFRSASGRLLFAGTRGYNDFDPLQLQESGAAPPVVITRIDVQYKPLESGVAAPMLDKLELDYQDKALLLEFAALDFTDPQRNQYAYRLEGFDTDWVQLGNQHRVSYTNLPAGDYVFQVKAASAGSVWNEVGARLPIVVHPAPWATWWAYVAYAAFAFLLFLAAYRHPSTRLREQQQYAQVLAREVADRTVELTQRNMELADASAAKSNFLARMSHEIRTPMNGVMGMTDLLSLTDLNATQRQYTQTISRSAQALLLIINDILDLSKVEAGRVELESLPFDLEHLIDDCVALMAPQANKKGLELVVAVDPDLPRAFLGDALRIRQVLTNLLGNALKFTSEGEISIRAGVRSLSTGHALVRLEVTDTGIGIEECAQERIFDAFSQVDESTTRHFSGTGLGLSICKQLTELMKGRIGVSSQLSVGSRFWCEIPLQLEDAERLTDPHSGIAGLRILLATPARSLQEAISRRVLADGADIITVDSSAAFEALVANREKYDVLVLDADGLGIFAEQLKNTPLPEDEEVVRILLSRQPGKQLGADSRRRQRDVWLAKPLSFKSLRQAVVSTRAQRKVVAAAQPASPVASQIEAPKARGRVLVAEDNPVNQLVAQGMLTKLGYEVSLADDGSAAIALLSTEHFDLILMDCQMPVMDGFEATKQIRALQNGEGRIPIIGLTAHASAEARDACLQAGMDDFLSKPYTLDTLGAMLALKFGEPPS